MKETRCIIKNMRISLCLPENVIELYCCYVEGCATTGVCTVHKSKFIIL
jgi:hypothetical protein